MCGIVAAFKINNNAPFDVQTFRSMLNELRFRGPDHVSVYETPEAMLGHARLSIIDLATGNQPVFNEDKTVACILNGEIYNFRSLRKILISKGHNFITQSDTEVIVHLYEEYGENLFEKLNGMFAVVVYDIKKRRMLVARDRLGEKPVIYHESNGLFLCASELKALLKYDGINREIDYEALSLYLGCLYVPSPKCIFKSCKKLPPATYLIINENCVTAKRYWQPSISILRYRNVNELQEEFSDIFTDAIKIRLEADVPIGVFLSGGIDSSAVTAYAALNSNQTISTFAAGFDSEIDERPFARIVADKYKTQHVDLTISALHADQIVEAMEYYDEPFSDTSSVPSYFISKEARKHVKVILTGDGGDELFSGYNSYINQKYRIGNRYVNRVVRGLNRASINLFNADVLGRLYRYVSSPGSRAKWLENKSYMYPAEIAAVLGQKSYLDSNFWIRNMGLRLNSDDPLSIAFEQDCNYYLPDDLLKKMDMASMANGLECRAPFLDHRLVEYALSIPPELKVANDVTKSFLRDAMKGYLPATITAREKHGFGSPIQTWLKHDLRESVIALTSPHSRIASILDISQVNLIVNSYLQVKSDNWRLPYQIWSLFALEIWLNKYM